MTLWIGIDPGLSGALGWKVDSGECGVFDAPVAAVKVGKATRRDYLAGAMHAHLAELCARFPHDEPQAAIEKVHSMPMQGVASMFSLGRGMGLWEGLLAGMSIPYQMVEPARWKKTVGLPVRADKGESRILAVRLFPELTTSFLRVKDDGRAEAILIMHWLRQSWHMLD